jgi:hypothetical protein
MHIVFNFPVGVVVGAVVAVVVPAAYKFVAKQVSSVKAYFSKEKVVAETSVKADVKAVVADVAKKV